MVAGLRELGGIRRHLRDHLRLGRTRSGSHGLIANQGLIDPIKAASSRLFLLRPPASLAAFASAGPRYSATGSSGIVLFAQTARAVSAVLPQGHPLSKTKRLALRVAVHHTV